jgi:hypothetical protein
MTRLPLDPMGVDVRGGCWKLAGPLRLRWGRFSRDVFGEDNPTF